MKKVYKKKLKGFEKFSSRHHALCGVQVFSGDRKCTCGRDDAIREWNEMKAKIQEKK